MDSMDRSEILEALCLCKKDIHSITLKMRDGSEMYGDVKCFDNHQATIITFWERIPKEIVIDAIEVVMNPLIRNGSIYRGAVC